MDTLRIAMVVVELTGFAFVAAEGICLFRRSQKWHSLGYIGSALAIFGSCMAAKVF